MQNITISRGDGIGPEIMESTLKILFEAGAKFEIDEIEVGKKQYEAGNTAGIAKDAWNTLRQNKVFLKAPITTPQGSGYKSLNVTIRKSLALFANVRPCKSLHPFVRSKHPDMDVVIVRENEEDTYAAIEHQQTDEVVQCLKLITRPGCEKINRYAFEFARQQNRKKVTCFTKDNIMKQTDGLFHSIFNEIAEEYPDIENENYIIDIGSARLADTPEHFDVIVTENLYGDIISDIAAQITGSVGLAGSANIGEECAMFEAIHGSAPDIAGKNIANPSGLLQASVMMLNHIGQSNTAEKVYNAWLRTIEMGVHTADIHDEERSNQKVSTTEFTEAVIDNLGAKPQHFAPAHYANSKPIQIPHYTRREPRKKVLQGVDLFVDWPGTNPDEIASMLQDLDSEHLKLEMITNRGCKVWPDGFSETFCTDHWRCRFRNLEEQQISKRAITNLLERADQNQVDVIKTENLYTFDGKPAFSLGQGQ